MSAVTTEVRREALDSLDGKDWHEAPDMDDENGSLW